jgi:hypothetical protein
MRTGSRPYQAIAFLLRREDRADAPSTHHPNRKESRNEPLHHNLGFNKLGGVNLRVTFVLRKVD